MAKRLTIPVRNHYRGELTKLRCWISGYREGRGNQPFGAIPGEDILRQLILAIDEASPRPTPTEEEPGK